MCSSSFIGIMEKRTKTTIMGYIGFRVWGLVFIVPLFLLDLRLEEGYWLLWVGSLPMLMVTFSASNQTSTEPERFPEGLLPAKPSTEG